MSKRYMVTSALPYANGPIHIGHLAGSFLPADVFVRTLRLLGEDVLYACGSDEHGAAITIRAKKEGLEPQQIIDKYHRMFDESLRGVGMSFDVYHRTSDPLHHETAQEIFLDLYRKGEFIEEVSEQYFDAEANQFLADRYITGTCPKCGAEDAYGDQCEKCGSTLSPLELINPKSTITGNVPVLKTTRHWYLPLDKYEDWLRDYIENGKLDGVQHHNPKDWKNHVLGQCKSWLDSGLKPRAMTRDLDWGVDVPHEIEGSDGKKLYVWMDAPIGYISATKAWAKEKGLDWEPYWKDADTKLIHFIGKDNIVFHSLTFPAVLKAHGGYILPYNVPANQFLNLEGDKISTSKNWAVWLHEYLEEFEGHEDELRYNLIRMMPEMKDSEFTWKGFQETTNNELVNTFANFVNRVVVLTNKYYDRVAPDFDRKGEMLSAIDNKESDFDSEISVLAGAIDAIESHIMKYDFRGALGAMMHVAALGNQFLQANEPWKKQKTEPDEVKPIMMVGLQYVAALSIIIRPFMPFTSDKMRRMLGLVPIEDAGEWKSMRGHLEKGNFLIAPGQKIGEPVHLFSRITDDVIAKQINKLEESAKSNKSVAYSPLRETATFDDFQKMDLRTGEIIEAEKIRKTKKLLKLKVDIGFEMRTVVSGIAEFYKPEDIIGQKVVLLANLSPRKIKGIDSEGMILMAEDTDGALNFIKPDEGWQNGAVVK